MSHTFYYGRPLHVTHAQLGVSPIRPRVGPPDPSRFGDYYGITVERKEKDLHFEFRRRSGAYGTLLTLDKAMAQGEDAMDTAPEGV
jgi:hypothetical protein